MDDALVPIIITAAAGLTTTVIGLVGGYWLGGRAERRRMKDGEVYRRLGVVQDAIDHMARLHSHLGTVKEEDAAGLPDDERSVTLASMSVMLADGAGRVQNGIFAAEELEGGEALAQAFAAAIRFIHEGARTGGPDIVRKLGGQLNNTRQAYEAPRKQLLG